MKLHSVDSAALLLLHRQSADENGGIVDPCDETLLDAALAYPLAQAATGFADIAAIAAAYFIGMLKYQPFVASSEQAGFLAMGLFLYSNGWRLNASEADTKFILQGVVHGEIDESALANWVRMNL
jgi:death on curing protein